tara:strand:- start:27 stop:473 length:447 start_codon:yes stop_codon:yes gene_type:complete
MKITEAKLRKIIRGVIREFVTTASAAGAPKDTSASTATTIAQADYDTKKSTRQGLSVAEPKTANGVAKKYQRPSRRGGYDYADTQRTSDYTTNTDYTTWETNKATADADEAAALAVLNQAKEADLQRTTPEKPPTTAAKKVTKKKKKD